jgi:hypothetical protein
MQGKLRRQLRPAANDLTPYRRSFRRFSAQFSRKTRPERLSYYRLPPLLAHLH